MRTRRIITVLGTTLAATALAASSAFAHECYNASRSATGNAHAANGQALSTYGELLDELCDDGDAIVQAWVDENSFDTEGIVVHTRALMGGGALANGNKATDDHDIDYLPPEFIESIGAAFGACFG